MAKGWMNSIQVRNESRIGFGIPAIFFGKDRLNAPFRVR